MCIWSNIHNRNFALYFILLEINLSIAKPQKFQFKSVILGAEISIFWVWDHSSITSAKRWLGWVRKWHFLLIYSTIHSDVLRWVGLKKTKTSWRNTWMVPKGQLISKGLFDIAKFFQKTNERVQHIDIRQKNKFVHSFFGRIVGLKERTVATFSDNLFTYWKNFS